MNNVYQCPAGLFKSPLKDELASYVQYKVNINGHKADSFIPKLRQFDCHCIDIEKKRDCLERAAVMGFLQLRKGESNNSLSARANALQGFLRYASTVLEMEAGYQIKLPKWIHSSYMPYIFSHKEIRTILNMAEEYRIRHIPACAPNLPNSMQCIITVLYCTGMRISETLNLEMEDIDLKNRVIHINHAKNDNCRTVTISGTLADALQTYLWRSRLYHMGNRLFFFSGSCLHSGHISIKTAYSYFRRYLEMSGIEHKGRGHGPRMHDFRATFAVHSLQKLTQRPGDVNSHLAVLSTYMGHKSIYYTQDYLWMTAELYQGTLLKMEGYYPVDIHDLDSEDGEVSVND